MLRSDSSGIGPHAIIYEITEGMELPLEIIESEIFKRLLFVAGLLLRAFNDMIGVGKDIADHFKLNIVLFHNQTEHTTMKDSFAAFGALHTKSVGEFDALVDEMMRKVVKEEWKERVERYVKVLRYSVTGCDLWQEAAAR